MKQTLTSTPVFHGGTVDVGIHRRLLEICNLLLTSGISLQGMGAFPEQSLLERKTDPMPHLKEAGGQPGAALAVSWGRGDLQSPSGAPGDSPGSQGAGAGGGVSFEIFVLAGPSGEFTA